MEWPVEYSDEFGAWWNGLSAEEQEDVDSGVASSVHPQMREQRVQHAGRPCRVLLA